MLISSIPFLIVLPFLLFSLSRCSLGVLLPVSGQAELEEM